ncbi:hypothetical protein BJX76DRAFT_327726, partial [Aspergillus varians]
NMGARHAQPAPKTRPEPAPNPQWGGFGSTNQNPRRRRVFIGQPAAGSGNPIGSSIRAYQWYCKVN